MRMAGGIEGALKGEVNWGGGRKERGGCGGRGRGEVRLGGGHRRETRRGQYEVGICPRWIAIFMAFGSVRM